MINTERIESLLARNGEDFVIGAYKSLLGRNPDQAGMRNYVEQVLLGVDKLDLLESFLLAPEGKRVAAAWGPALARYREQYRPRKSSSLLNILKRVPLAVHRWIIPSDSLIAVSTNAGESQNAENSDSKKTKWHRMAETIASYQLNNWVPAVSTQEQTDKLMQLSQPAQDIYIKLLAAIVNKSNRLET
jgi:hypothetical protein